MARATNPGAPQRVSAHVVPKAPSFSADDEEEKTTIESGGWEEEASTTVEQGEVADKVRALALGAAPARSNTGITSTTGSGVTDEPTVDDQRASAALAMLPPPSVARLVVTEGNDAGRSIEVRPGKTYTIGRGIDNDLVLSDITASRKHFDLRNDNGSWVLADRGSGNGTLINHRIEDGPFVLASGDHIEVGNTAFRFELAATAIALPGLPPSARAPVAVVEPSSDAGDDGEASDSREMPTPEVAAAPPVPREPAASDPRDADIANGIPREVPNPGDPFQGAADDDLEASTMSGQPLPPSEGPRPAVTASRPKTLPPPAPLARPRTQSGRPAMAYAAQRSQQLAVPQAQAMAPVVLAGPMAPTISPVHAAPAVSPHAPVSQPLRPPISPSLLEPPHAAQGTTLPGQGPPLPMPRGPRLPFSYPGAPELLPRRISGPLPAQMHVSPGVAGRDAPATAQVQPMAYSGNHGVMVPRRAQLRMPPITRRVKLTLAAAGLVVFAAIATVAIIRGARDEAAPIASWADRADPSAAMAPTATRPTPDVTPIQVTAPPPTQAAPTPQSAPQPPPPTQAAPTPQSAPQPPPPTQAAATTQAQPTAQAAPTTEAAPTPQAQPQSTTQAPSVTQAAATTQTPSEPAVTAQPVAPQRSPSDAPATAAPATAAATPPPSAGRAPARPEPPAARASSERPTSRAEASRPRAAKHAEVRRAEHRAAEAAPTRAERKHAGRTLQDVKAEANGLYRSKNFNGAALAITSSLAGFGSDDARDLKNLASIYTQLGKAYAVGMAYGTRSIDAYQALQRGIKYDRDVGSAHVTEMRERLAVVAPKAAGSFMAVKSYAQALQAVRDAEALGSTSASLQAVRSTLDGVAHELLSEARKQKASDPEGAKQKARQVQDIVDARSPLHAQAQRLLNSP